MTQTSLQSDTSNEHYGRHRDGASNAPVVLRADRFDSLDHLLFEAEGSTSYADYAADRLQWIVEAARVHVEQCAPYARLAKAQGFDPEALRRTGNLASV